jgi:hypothetical protein
MLAFLVESDKERKARSAAQPNWESIVNLQSRWINRLWASETRDTFDLFHCACTVYRHKQLPVSQSYASENPRSCRPKKPKVTSRVIPTKGAKLNWESIRKRQRLNCYWAILYCIGGTLVHSLEPTDNRPSKQTTISTGKPTEALVRKSHPLKSHVQSV